MGVRLAEQRQSLAASEQRFRDLFASSPTPLLELDGRHRIRGANPAAASFLGCDPDQAIERSVIEFLEGPDDATLRGALEMLQAGGEAVVEARWRLAGGERAEVELHMRPAGEPATPGYLMAIHDLTDRVRRLGERWRRTFDAMVDGVALVDTDGDVVLANQALSRHLEAVRPMVAQHLRNGEPSEWRLPSQGRLLQCSLTVPSELGHGILVARDVTDAVRAESRLREADKMQAVGTLASGVAHDFNNLLAAIQLHVRWLEREPEAGTEAAAAIRDLANEGIEVVRELLLFARRESTPPRTVDLSSLVAGQEGVLSHLMPEGVELRIRTAPDSVPVAGNPVALRRLLLNLVLNARDAVAADGGRIEVGVMPAGDRATLEVADNGPGIPAEHRDRLFEPFFSLRRHGRGAGLGLAVVYAIVTEHGGEIEVESDGRSGSRFVVRLPLGRSSDLEPLTPLDDGVEEADRERVLLVDDDGREAATLVEALATAGLQVRHATSVSSAQEVLERWSPTAVVAVPELPDGEVAEWLDSVELPAVLLQGSSGADPPTAATRLATVRRPVAAEALLAALYRLGVRAPEDRSS
jgi:two-component system cell cycle sensor histidine kinase/response regulator CckA